MFKKTPNKKLTAEELYDEWNKTHTYDQQSANAVVRKFESGAIRDNDSTKEDYTETISWRAFKRYAKYMTSKKSKYGSGNFKKGIPIESYEQSLLRHVQKYMENKYEGGKVEVGEDHLSAIVFNVFGIMHEENK